MKTTQSLMPLNNENVGKYDKYTGRGNYSTEINFFFLT
jgi:hypothetical protein